MLKREIVIDKRTLFKKNEGKVNAVKLLILFYLTISFFWFLYGIGATEMECSYKNFKEIFPAFYVGCKIGEKYGPGKTLERAKAIRK